MTESWGKQKKRTATDLDLAIYLIPGIGSMATRYAITIQDEDGVVMATLDGDLIPYLSVANLSKLESVYAAILDKATSEIL